jgi:hypothetical protein
MAKKKGGFTTAIQPQTVEEVRPLTAEHFEDIWNEGIRNLEAATPRITRTIDFEPTPEHRYPRFLDDHTVKHKKLEQITKDLTIKVTVDTDLDPEMLYDRFISVALWQNKERKSQLFLNSLTSDTYFIRTFYYDKSLIIDNLDVLWKMIKDSLMKIKSLNKIIFFNNEYYNFGKNSVVGINQKTIKSFGFRPSEEFENWMVFQLR